jgi:secondary thiamine-phosphate synthase enzyme
MATIETQRHGAKVLQQTLTVPTAARLGAHDVTPEVRDMVRRAGIDSGLVIANCLHTTWSVLVAESGVEQVESLVRVMERMVDERARYRHNDSRVSDCERGNAAAHLRTSLLGHGVTIGVGGGELLLDRSDSILLTEWDGPRARLVYVQIMGV